MKATAYVPPALIEIGDFADLTRITNRGGYIDNPFVTAWWL